MSTKKNYFAISFEFKTLLEPLGEGGPSLILFCFFLFSERRIINTLFHSIIQNLIVDRAPIIITKKEMSTYHVVEETKE